jgi:membrane protease YdiL (CAAX protease family)
MSHPVSARFDLLRAFPRAVSLAWACICVLGALTLPVGAVMRSLVLAPLLEETVFRLGVHDALSMRLPNGAIAFVPAMTAVAFAGLHVVLAPDVRAWALAVATAIPAWWIGVMYERDRDRRLGPCVAWHAGFNLVWLGGLRSLFPAWT